MLTAFWSGSEPETGRTSASATNFIAAEESEHRVSDCILFALAKDIASTNAQISGTVEDHLEPTVMVKFNGELVLNAIPPAAVLRPLVDRRLPSHAIMLEVFLSSSGD